MSEPERFSQDVEHLGLLGIFHYVGAGMVALFGCFPVFHLIIGMLMVVSPIVFGPAPNYPPPFIGWLFVILALAIMLAAWTFAGLLAWAGRCLRARKRYTFCLIIAFAECCFTPVGTVLGVFSIIVLMRPSVKHLFNSKAFMPHPT